MLRFLLSAYLLSKVEEEGQMKNIPLDRGKDILQEKWRERLCPIVNGIILGNGKITVLEYSDNSKKLRKLCHYELKKM